MSEVVDQLTLIISEITRESIINLNNYRLEKKVGATNTTASFDIFCQTEIIER